MFDPWAHQQIEYHKNADGVTCEFEITNCGPILTRLTTEDGRRFISRQTEEANLAFRRARVFTPANIILNGRKKSVLERISTNG